MPALRHLALRCRDMEASRRFYELAIGFQFVGYRPSGMGLDLSDGVNNMTLLQHPLDADRSPMEEGNEFIHFGVIVEDLEACYRRLREQGAIFSKDDVKLRNEIQEAHLPTRSFKVLDPDGNVVDVTGNREEWRGVRL